MEVGEEASRYEERRSVDIGEGKETGMRGRGRGGVRDKSRIRIRGRGRGRGRGGVRDKSRIRKDNFI